MERTDSNPRPSACNAEIDGPVEQVKLGDSAVHSVFLVSFGATERRPMTLR